MLQGTGRSGPLGLRDVRLRLTRKDRGALLDVRRRPQRFAAMNRCGARARHVLLGRRERRLVLPAPGALGRGRYVLDLRTVDGAGNATTRLAADAQRGSCSSLR